jgi:hypothetical protein
MSLTKSPADSRLSLMWRLVRPTFWLSTATALLYVLVDFQRGYRSRHGGDGMSEAFG